jgi:hypothetical protein
MTVRLVGASQTFKLTKTGLRPKSWSSSQPRANRHRQMKGCQWPRERGRRGRPKRAEDGGIAEFLHRHESWTGFPWLQGGKSPESALKNEPQEDRKRFLVVRRSKEGGSSPFSVQRSAVKKRKSHQKSHAPSGIKDLNVLKSNGTVNSVPFMFFCPSADK